MNSTPARHINFLEVAPGAKESLSLNYFWMIAAMAVFCMAAGGYAYYQTNRIKAMQAQVDEANNEIARIKETQSKQEADSLSGKAMKEVLNDPIVWSSLVNKIIKKIPDSIKLREISGGIADKRSLTIRGHSSYLLPVFRLKKNLATLAECENTALVSLEQSRSENDNEQIAFHLECKLL